MKIATRRRCLVAVNTENSKVRRPWFAEAAARLGGSMARLNADGYIAAMATPTTVPGAITKLRRRWPLTDPATRATHGASLLQAIAAWRGGRREDAGYANTAQVHRFACAQGHRFSSPAKRVFEGHWCPECAHDERRLGLADAQAFAHQRGGTCLSTAYRTIGDRLRWRCAEGHHWEAAYHRLLRSKEWCPKCRATEHANDATRTFEQLKGIAGEHGGQVISPAYLGARTKLRFQCAAGHAWEAMPDNVLKKGSWCRQCSSNWRSPGDQLKELRQVVRTQGGRLLYKVYVNRITKLDVQCAKGHVWSVQPSKLKLGRWCPECHYERMRTYKTQKKRTQCKSLVPVV